MATIFLEEVTLVIKISKLGLKPNMAISKKEVFIDGRIKYTLFNKTITHRISVLKELFVYKNANEEEKANALFNNLEKEEFDSDLRLTIAILFESMKRLNDEANWKHFEENLAESFIFRGR